MEDFEVHASPQRCSPVNSCCHTPWGFLIPATSEHPSMCCLCVSIWQVSQVCVCFLQTGSCSTTWRCLKVSYFSYSHLSFWTSVSSSHLHALGGVTWEATIKNAGRHMKYGVIVAYCITVIHFNITVLDASVQLTPFTVIISLSHAAQTTSSQLSCNLGSTLTCSA